MVLCLQKSPATYVAILTGDQMVPPVNTTAHGEADFMVHHKEHKKDKTDTVSYNITLFDVNHLVEVDMRQAPPGAPGDKIASLFGPEANGVPQVSIFLHAMCQDFRCIERYLF